MTLQPPPVADSSAVSLMASTLTYSRKWGQSKLRKENPDLTGPDKKRTGLLGEE